MFDMCAGKARSKVRVRGHVRGSPSAAAASATTSVVATAPQRVSPSAVTTPQRLPSGAAARSTATASSVSSTPGSFRTPRPKTAKTSLKFPRVQSTPAEQQRQTGGGRAASTVPVPVFKKFVIKESTIPGAGNGLFLLEGAKHGEPIARYSGKLLSKAQAEASSSDYIIQVTKSKFLCAEADDEWEGRASNCARKAGRTCNARFAANGQILVCKASGKHYIKVFAVGDIKPTEEVLPDYGPVYWKCNDSAGGYEQLRTPPSNHHTASDDSASVVTATKRELCVP